MDALLIGTSLPLSKETPLKQSPILLTWDEYFNITKENYRGSWKNCN